MTYIILIITIGLLIAWISFLFERCYKFSRVIEYKQTLIEHNVCESKKADELIEEMDNMFKDEIL